MNFDAQRLPAVASTAFAHFITDSSYAGAINTR